jgi:hypothetical protein
MDIMGIMIITPIITVMAITLMAPFPYIIISTTFIISIMMVTLVIILVVVTLVVITLVVILIVVTTVVVMAGEDAFDRHSDGRAFRFRFSWKNWKNVIAPDQGVGRRNGYFLKNLRSRSGRDRFLPIFSLSVSISQRDPTEILFDL